MKKYNVSLTKCFTLLGLFLVGFQPGISYSVHVSPIVKNIEQNTASENYVTIRNTKKDEVEYVQMDLFKVMNPGEATEQLEPELEKANPSIVFSPTRLILQAGKERKVRLLPMKSVEHEEVYRLRVISAQPPEESGGENVTNKGRSSAITMNIGYDVLIRLIPTGDLVQQITVDCSSGHYKLRSTGNVRSEMTNVVADGTQLGRFNVYPTREKQLIQSKTLSFDLAGKTFKYQGCVQE